jgi:tripartite-type tricarboxylate transporter receptor subunit TctC
MAMGVSALAAAQPAGEGYPGRPIRMIIPFLPRLCQRRKSRTGS